MKRVLCVCLGNTCRSPMMQALLQKELGDGFQVESAGIRKEAAGQPANENSLVCMHERGIDLNGHRSRWIGNLDPSDYAYIVCVGEKEAEEVAEMPGFDPKETTLLIANGENGGVPNPFQKGLPAYRECLALLDTVMPQVADIIR
jgi:protein-tyrosine-phosphatase